MDKGFNIKDVFSLFDRQWALVTAGGPGGFNTMTISWGGLGTLWSLPVAAVFVRPSRYTHEFMEREPLFTVSFFGPEHKKELGLLGTLSGRDCDKVGMTGLTPVPIDCAAGRTMGFAEAELTLVCRKLFSQDMEKALLDPAVAADNYGENEPAHTVYIGEAVEVIEKQP